MWRWGQPEGIGTFTPGGVALNDFFRTYVNTAQAVLRPETATNYNFTAEFAPTAFLKGLDLQVTWYQIKVNNALTQFGNPSNSSVNNPSRGQFYIVPTDIAKTGVDVAGCSNNNTPATCPEFERIVAALLAEPNSPLHPNIHTTVLWLNDGAIGNWGWQKMQGIDFNASYDCDAGNLGAFNAGIVGTYFLHLYQANNPSSAVPNPPIVDTFHEDISGVGGINETALEYRSRDYNTAPARAGATDRCQSRALSISADTFSTPRTHRPMSTSSARHRAVRSPAGHYPAPSAITPACSRPSSHSI